MRVTRDAASLSFRGRRKNAGQPGPPRIESLAYLAELGESSVPAAGAAPQSDATARRNSE